WGPFLEKQGDIYFPTPLDVVHGNQLLKVKKLDGLSDLPGPLRYGLFAPGASKTQPGKFISLSELKKYLGGGNFSPSAESDFYDREARPGITIDPKTHAVDKGKYYSAEYLRLKPGVSLAAGASMAAGGGLMKLFDPAHRTLMLGGQQSIMYADPQPGQITLPPPKISGTFVKWVLLTPTLWSRGWLPDFVDDVPADQEWNLKLAIRPQELPPRLEGENRTEYRRRTAGVPVTARLVAARVGKPLPVSGWKMQGSGGGVPRATRMLVPAGSVYYFETSDEDQARLLVRALHGRTLSNFGGTSGLGFGVCGTFDVSISNQ
ncbi:MAG: hypothetical protein IKO93_07790, partial [Lentisphaeria bacterium]|nr:hypothetical protein [Lentisphaeria bacterium]